MQPSEESRTRQTSATLPVFGPDSDFLIADEIKRAVESASQILVTGHERPDGDCAGSVMALCLILQEAGYKASGVLSDAPQPKYQFLGSAGVIRVPEDHEALKADLVFVLDATDLRRLGRIGKEQFGAARIVNIDHHLGNPNFGQINWVDAQAAATGELIWRLAACCKWRVPLSALQSLYAAIITDTGQFSYSNTSARVLRMAAEMVERGVDPEAIWQQIYLNRTQAELALEACARNSLECLAGGKICCVSLTHKDFQATGTGPRNTEEITGIPRSLQGVVLSIFFYEIDEGRQTKVSLRSTRDIDARALAQKFGGGGHKQASGCTIPGPLAEVKKRFLEAALDVIV